MGCVIGLVGMDTNVSKSKPDKLTVEFLIQTQSKIFNGYEIIIETQKFGSRVVSG